MFLSCTFCTVCSFGFSCKYFVNRHHQHLRMTKSIEYSLLSLNTISKKKKSGWTRLGIESTIFQKNPKKRRDWKDKTWTHLYNTLQRSTLSFKLHVVYQPRKQNIAGHLWIKWYLSFLSVKHIKYIYQQ